MDIIKGNFYGKLTKILCNSEIDLYVEVIKNEGFAIIEDVLIDNELEQYRKRIDKIYECQKK